MLFVGAVSFTVEAPAAATVTEIGAEVVVTPTLSVATAVREYVPAATLVHVCA